MRRRHYCAANAVINLSSEGFGKCLKAHRKGGDKPRLVTVANGVDEALFVADEIEDRIEQGRSIKNVAVLIRAARHSSMLEIELAPRGIAFKKFGGTKFTEAAHIKDVISLLRWAENQGNRVKESNRPQSGSRGTRRPRRRGGV